LRNLTKGDNDRAVEESIITGRDAPYNPNRCDLLRPIYYITGDVIKENGYELNGHGEQLTPEYINEYKHFRVLGDVSRDLNSGGEFIAMNEHDPLDPSQNGGKITRNKKSRKRESKRSRKLSRMRIRRYRNTRRNKSRL
jgi:hypothetical protein